ncbi:hypothetical protein Thal_0602 [Thermocrinis albus DSM 14484]|uniref:Uncharacterized protein n=1 Tax=Thermocrinis albus (strain DSM 14484 / JCM 11386 / HI 11/12) TaxID=638303 RepID=D3SPZ9_THEAH|nr:hypothetical protein [Thermocrinis albus]ADC89236.1 hypothetical protein Thal_0602 [Thermocrinis albus DSM 14484]
MRRYYLLLLLLMITFLRAQEEKVLTTPLTARLHDMNVSIGVVSIDELKTSFPRAYNLLVQYHGEPKRNETHHLAVAIWKQEGQKIVYLSNYRVDAEVRSPLLRAQRKHLSKYPHQYGDNYGGWFEMSDRGLYSINVYITDDKGRTRRVSFDYLLQ